MTITSETKYGPQPIRDAVWRAGITHNDFIAKMATKPLNHTRLAMNGLCPPSVELRHRAAHKLRLPVEQLFTVEALAAILQPSSKRRGPGPKAHLK